MSIHDGFTYHAISRRKHEKQEKLNYFAAHTKEQIRNILPKLFQNTKAITPFFFFGFLFTQVKRDLCLNISRTHSD
jgi:hypothetical protein